MPLSATRDPDSDARRAAWLARDDARDWAARRRFMTIVPIAVAMALIVYLWFALTPGTSW